MFRGPDPWAKLPILRNHQSKAPARQKLCEITYLVIQLAAARFQMASRSSSFKSQANHINTAVDAGYVLTSAFCLLKVNWHALQGSIYSGEDHQVLLITCCILPFPTPLFDGVSWPWSRLRRFRGFYKPAEFSGHSQVWQNACPGLVRKPCIGSGPRGRRFRIQS